MTWNCNILLVKCLSHMWLLTLLHPAYQCLHSYKVETDFIRHHSEQKQPETNPTTRNMQTVVMVTRLSLFINICVYVFILLWTCTWAQIKRALYSLHINAFSCIKSDETAEMPFPFRMLLSSYISNWMFKQTCFNSPNNAHKILGESQDFPFHSFSHSQLPEHFCNNIWIVKHIRCENWTFGQHWNAQNR